ncbi:type II toxin-antitoxin system RelE/ParE family toxin [Frankia sp. CiP3]|uniref:type II toxin-antitoxin system RelE/ParE family toxin n=1 Tax=Frankia sp. CiP3 TaxID=2880971 RepID=UPI001EF4F546|nr:type II toxin-antitoxin system RelE/ParE family toxin [Frankia sp. CiP3]
MPWDVLVHPDAVDELAKLPAKERAAIDSALDKLRERGTDLPFPHTSAVVDADRLWELRPRGGNSPWRAFYRRMGQSSSSLVPSDTTTSGSTGGQSPWPWNGSTT